MATAHPTKQDMAKQSAVFCGEFYSDETNDGSIVGHVYKLPTGLFVIRGIEAFSGRTLWQSAEFKGSHFRRFRVLNLGYANVNMYVAKVSP